MEVDRTPARFIPFRKTDVIDMCLADGSLPSVDAAAFRRFCQVLVSVFHFEYHDTLEQLKNLYAPVNPDRDTRRPDGQDETDIGEFASTLETLLTAANYDRLDQQAIEAAFEEASLFKIKLKIDFDAYSEVLLYVRGESQKTEQVKMFGGLVTRDIAFTNYDRVVLYVKYRDDVAPESSSRKGATLLKLFQNVPKADIEMLFPSTQIAMRNIDKLLIGVPAIAGAVAIATTKAGASLIVLLSLVGFWLGLHSEAVHLDQAALVAIVAGIGGLGSYVWKQFSNFRNRKLLFMQSLTQNLYFKNLDNNAGVFHRLIDDAEEEECKEAILGYYFLLTKGEMNASDLDGSVESWFSGAHGATLDFEVADALSKLVRLGLVTESQGIYSAVPIVAASRLLDKRWDNYFDFSNLELPGSQDANQEPIV